MHLDECMLCGEQTWEMSRNRLFLTELFLKTGYLLLQGRGLWTPVVKSLLAPIHDDAWDSHN